MLKNSSYKNNIHVVDEFVQKHCDTEVRMEESGNIQKILYVCKERQTMLDFHQVVIYSCSRSLRFVIQLQSC